LTYLFKSTWRAIIIFRHNFVIFIAVALWFRIWAGWFYFEAILGFVLLTINGMWMALFLARYPVAIVTFRRSCRAV